MKAKGKQFIPIGVFLLFIGFSTASMAQSNNDEKETQSEIKLDKSNELELRTIMLSEPISTSSQSTKIGGFNSNDYDKILGKSIKFQNDKSLYFLHDMIRNVEKLASK